MPNIVFNAQKSGRIIIPFVLCQVLYINLFATDPLFKITDSSDNDVFEVYSDSMIVKNSTGDALLTVGNNGTKVYFLDEATKGSAAGFAVGGINRSKSTTTYDYMNITKRNTFIGNEAGKSNTTGNNNSFIGYQSGRTNTTGSNNSFMGYQTGYSNLSGQYNSFIGYQSGRSNTTGTHNSFMGHQCGYSNQDGCYNSFYGYLAGNKNVGGSGDYDGDYNSFFGYFAGNKNVDGYRNTFMGYYSGYENVSGQRNVFYGGFSGHDNTANDNTFIGYLSGRYNSSGTYNNFLGYSSGSDNTTGNYNLCLGQNSGDGNQTGNNNIFIGRNAGDGGTSCSDKLYINSSAAASATPLIYGDFASDYVVINGTNNNSKTFYVTGSAGGSGAWSSKSDQRLKKNIHTIPNSLDKVRQLRGVNYEWRDPNNYEPGTRIGFIAQEVEQVLPEVVEKESEYYSVQYAPVTALLVEAVKEQQIIIEELKIRNQSLVRQQSALQTDVAELKKVTGKLSTALKLISESKSATVSERIAQTR